MLQQIREKTKGWVATFVIILICVPFAFWGVSSFFGGGPAAPVAEIEGEEVSEQEFQQAYQNRYRIEQYINQGAEIDEAALKATVMETLVNRRVLLQWTQKAGYAVSDQQVGEAIRDNTRFQDENGKFSFDQYRNTIANQGYTPDRFEIDERNRLRLTQLRDETANHTLVPAAEVAALYRVEQQQRDLQVARIEVAGLLDGIEVDDAAIQAWYQDNLDDYRTERRMRAAYLSLNVADFVDDSEIPEADLQARYEADKARFGAPEERRSSHILISTSDLSEDEALAKAAELKAELDGGAEFGALASEHSDDTGSAVNNGDLGWAAKDGRFVEPFENALFALESVGSVSEPVVSQFGVHVIRLDEIREERTKPFEEVRDQLAEDIRDEQAQDAFAEATDQLWDLTLETPDTLATAADALGLEIQTTDWFTFGAGQGIAAHADVREAAFDPSVMDDGDNTDLIEVNDDQVVVLRKAEYQPERQKDLDEVREEIVAALKQQKAEDLATEQADKLVAAVEAGKSLADAAVELKVAVDDLPGVKRSGFETDRDVIAAAFALPRPVAGPSVTAVNLDSGDRAVVVVTKAVDGNAADATEAELEALADRIRFQRGTTEFAALVRNLRAKASVKIAHDRL